MKSTRLPPFGQRGFFAYVWGKWYNNEVVARKGQLMHLPATEFEDLVVEALDSLPESLLEVMSNVDVTVQPWPTREQLKSVGVRRGTLLGLYEGIPLTRRHSSSYSLVMPDKVTIFQRPIERICSTREEIVGQVRETVIHEIAHHFGIDDDRLIELGW